jgi:ubiquitin-protein ligase
MNSVRQRRLLSDYDGVMALVRASDERLVVKSTTGTPPDTYRLLFHCRSVVKFDDDAAIFGRDHYVRIYLPAAYPAVAPVATMLSQVLHPHIWPNRVVCLGPWSPQEKLSSVLLRIASILIYEPGSLNWRSVADESVVPWALRNQELLPLDMPWTSAARENTPQGQLCR